MEARGGMGMGTDMWGGIDTGICICIDMGTDIGIGNVIDMGIVIGIDIDMGICIENEASPPAPRFTKPLALGLPIPASEGGHWDAEAEEAGA